MFVCHCRGVTDRTIAAAVAAGADSVEEIGRRCGAGVDCGGCAPALARLVEKNRRERPTEADHAA